MVYVEAIFFVDMLLQFFLSYDPKSAMKEKKVKEVSKTSLHYL